MGVTKPFEEEIARLRAAGVPGTAGRLSDLFDWLADHGRTHLTFDQIASDRALCMPLRHHQTQPLPGSIHSLDGFSNLACG